MPAPRPLIAGNWKMNGSLAEAAVLARAIVAGAANVRAGLILCPPAVHLLAVAPLLAGSGIGLGAQDCHAAAQGAHAGAHTGDISAAMLRDIGAGWVIVGHSERRTGHAETDAAVLAKASAAMAAGLRPIICVGESLAEREAGQAEAIVAGQLAGSLPPGFAAAGGVVAYEPVWAIGTGRTPTEADIAAMHKRIRAEVIAICGLGGADVPLLYGGSVKPGNAATILALPEVNGALVGGASLAAADFLAIAAAV